MNNRKMTVSLHCLYCKHISHCDNPKILKLHLESKIPLGDTTVTDEEKNAILVSIKLFGIFKTCEQFGSVKVYLALKNKNEKNRS
jgi:hypothetical protein